MKTQSFGRSGQLFCMDDGSSLPLDHEERGEDARNNARADYVRERSNGTAADSPYRDFPKNGSYSWESGPSYIPLSYTLRYNEGPGDKAWMEEKDRNYLARMIHNGELSGWAWRFKIPFKYHNLAKQLIREKEETGEVQTWLKRQEEAERRQEEEQRRREEAERKRQEEEQRRREEAERKRRKEEQRRREEPERKRREAEERHQARLKKLADHQKQGAAGVIKAIEAKEDEAFLTELIAAMTATALNELDKHSGQTPLHRAAALGRLELVEQLVAAGANVLAEDGFDETPRDMAKRGESSEHRKIASYLKKQEAKVKRVSVSTVSSDHSSTSAAGAGPAVSLLSPSVDMTSARYYIPPENLDVSHSRSLGAGGFGRVFTALWRAGDVDVAVKELGGALTAKGQRALMKEAQTMHDIRHPHIVSFFGVSRSHDGRYRLVMELMVRGSLYDLLHSEQDIPWTLRLNMAKDIAAGLSLLHRRGMLHRDLKSLNVLLDDRGRAKLSDFGLAEIKDEVRSSTTTADKAVGTLQWMAPELFRLKPKYSERSDMYAYGLVLWELASRDIPYKGAVDQVIKDAVKNGEREDIPEACPSAFALLIQSCWAQAPGDRPLIDIAMARLNDIRLPRATEAIAPSGPVYTM